MPDLYKQQEYSIGSECAVTEDGTDTKYRTSKEKQICQLQ